MDMVPQAASEDRSAAALLVNRIRAGGRSAEEDLVTRYTAGVLAIAAARTRDYEAARDLAQEIFIHVLKAMREGQVREPEKLSAFIQGTARNVINNFLRSRTRSVECALDTAELPGKSIVEELESAERHRLLQRELASVDANDRQILLWSLVDGGSMTEIAERLNMSHDVVRARKSRLIKKIAGKFSSLSQK
jgi:RNA polymerase sigma-70 factor (ECF subfamily)